MRNMRHGHCYICVINDLFNRQHEAIYRAYKRRQRKAEEFTVMVFRLYNQRTIVPVVAVHSVFVACKLVHKLLGGSAKKQQYRQPG